MAAKGGEVSDNEEFSDLLRFIVTPYETRRICAAQVGQMYLMARIRREP